MKTRFYTPHPLLREFVNCIMIVHAQIDSPAHPVICPYPPAPQDSLFFYLDDLINVKKYGSSEYVLQPRSVLVGTQLQGVSININRSHKAVRVGFHPGGIYRLLGVPATEFIDSSFNAEDVFGTEMRNLNERLADCSEFDQIKTVIEDFLLNKSRNVRNALPFDRSMLELVKHGGNLSIDEAASLACLSVRQFERISKHRVGMSPKLYARLIRFSRAYRMRENFSNYSWTHIAHQCGYFDQMHLIRDFKLFVGVTPTHIDKELDAAPVRLQSELRI